MSEQVAQPIIQPTENRRQCLIWTGVLCTIAYALFALVDLASLTVRPSLTMDELESYYRFIKMLLLIAGICFVGGMVSLVVFKPNRITPYFGLAGGCLYLMIMLVLLCEIDFTEFFEDSKLALNVFYVFSGTSVVLMALPVLLLKDRVVSVMRYMGMIGAAIVIEKGLLKLLALVFRDGNDNSHASVSLKTLNEVHTSFDLVAMILIFLFYVAFLACQNKNCGKSVVPYKWYSGRSCGREYWIKSVCLMLIAVVGGMVVFSYIYDASSGSYPEVGLLSRRSDFSEIRSAAYCYSLMWFLPFSLAAIPVSVRRLHDQGLSGWWLIVVVPFLLIPLVGWLAPITMFVFIGCLEGTVGPNQYGPDPKAAEHERLRAMFAARNNLVIQNNNGTVNTPTPAPTPTPTPASESRQSVEDRLVSLQGLKEKGLITEEEYQKKRETILSEL